MTATILIIDGSEDDQRLYQRAFKDFDTHFRLRMASSAKAGLECVAHAGRNPSSSTRPDLILIDYHLPDMDGLSLMKKLAEYPETPIPVVMLTGEGSTAVAVEAMKHGADDCLVKDTEGRYLRLLPPVAKRVLAAHLQRQQSLRLQRETEMLLRRNQTLMHNAMDGIHILDVRGNLVEANDAFCRMLGYAPEEIARLNVADWNAQWSAGELRERFKDLVGKSARFETVWRRKDGALINVEISVSSMEIEGVSLFFGASRDITERKKVEGMLRQHKAVIDTSIDGFWACDMQGNVVEANESYAKISGYTVEELVTMHISELEAKEEVGDVKAHIDKIVAQGYDRFETFHRRKDGHEADIEVSVTYMAEPERMFVFCRDITERKKSEAALKQHKLMLDTSIDGFWVVDMGGNLLEANEAYAKLSGYTVAELCGMHISQLEALEQAVDVKARIAEIVAQGYGKFETRHRRKDGREVDVEISSTFIAGLQKFVVFCRDISERKRVEKEQRLSAQLLNSTSDSVFLIDLEGNFVHLNEAAWKSRGYTRDQLMAMNVRELTTPESGKLVALRIKDLLEKGHVVFESEHRCKDGSIMSVEVSSRVIESGGKLILSSCRDITERKKIEAMLRQYKLVLDTSIDGFWVCDMNGRLLEANEAYAKISGYSVAELVGMQISQLEAIELSPEVVAAHLAKVAAQGYDRFETRHRHKDGHEIDIEVAVTYVAEAQRAVVFCRDISERKRASLALQRKQDLLNAAQRLGKLGSWELDLLSGVLDWSDEMYRIFETDPARFSHSYEGFLNAVHPDDRDKVNQAYTKSLRDRQPYDVVHRLLFADGRVKWVREHCTNIFDVSGKPLRSTGMSQDITGRVEAEAALLQGEANLRAMLDNSPYLTWLKDTDGRYLAINKVFADYLRLKDANEAIGKTDLDLQPKELAEKYRADDAEVMAARRRKTVEEAAFDGKNTLWVETFKTPIIDAHDNVLGTVGFARDVTERKKAEHKLLLESEAEHRRAEVLAQQFGELLRSSFNEIYLFDAESLCFLQVSEGAKKNLGYSGDEMQQLTPLDLNPLLTPKSFRKLIAPLTGGKQQTLLFETVHRRKDGTTYPVEVRLQLIVPEPRVFVAVVQDITERQRAENQLREFATHLQNVREEEKTSIAREIHDDLGGTLTALKLDAHWLAGQLGANEDTALLERAESMCALLDTAVRAVRRIINDLRPAILDDFGLIAAIKWQCGQFQQRTGIECRTVCIYDEDDTRGNELDKAISVNLFRIAQEALTNVVRHSGASRVEIRLQQSAEEVVLSVCDNGRGIPVGQAVAATSHGMRGMCERVKQLDGIIKFDSPPGGGLCLTVTIPC